MANLTRANQELFRRQPDERFSSLDQLYQHCYGQHQASTDRWHLPGALRAVAGHDPDTGAGRLELQTQEADSLLLNDWSFTQLCTLARVSKDTLNKLSPETASRVFQETLPGGTKPLQVYTQGDLARSIHGASYTRLHHVDLLNILREFATDFQPPQEAEGGGSGLYCGEQDLFCFVIDPTGWVETDGQAFAPGLFLWNSEVGKRSLGVQTFWWQAVCKNHIVWDAIEVVEFTRKHTAHVHDSLSQVRHIIEALVAKRDQRRDGFVQVIRNAMRTHLGSDSEEVLKVLARHGIAKSLAKEAVETAQQQGLLTIFAVVDALTRMAGRLQYAGDRTEADEKASSLLALAV